MEAGKGSVRRLMESLKPYFLMVCLQIGYAGMFIINKISLNRGMSHYVLVVYRHAFAAAAMAPFALIFETKVRPKMTFYVFIRIFVMGLLGPVIDLNFFYAGLKYTSPTFAVALSNILPAMTFVMAVIFRMEKLEVRNVRCQAKLVGTVVTLCGAMLMTLYKGNVVNFFWSHHIHSLSSFPPPSSPSSADKDWLKGSIFLIVGPIAWAAFFILQAVTLKRYPADLSLSALVCFFGTLQSIAVTLVMEHKPSAWKIGWDLNLLSAAYAGIVASGIAYYVQGLVMKIKGPVFVTAFNPLVTLIVAVMGSFILAEQIYLGGVLGGIVIVIGLYAVLWGKSKENRETAREIDEPVKRFERETPKIKENYEDDDIEIQIGEITPVPGSSAGEATKA